MGKKIMSVAPLRGYNIVLTETDSKVPKQSKVLKDIDKDLLKPREVDQKAYSELFLACQGDIAFGIVEKSVTKDLQMVTQIKHGIHLREDLILRRHQTN